MTLRRLSVAPRTCYLHMYFSHLCLMANQTDMLELTTQALVCLLQAQPILADQVPSLGHIPRLCRQMAIQNSQPSVYKTAILILHQLATSEVSYLCRVSACIRSNVSNLLDFT